MRDKEPHPGARGAGDREVLSRAYDPKNSDRTEQLQGLNVEIDARRDAELVALQRLTPWLSKEKAQRLRPAFHIWCEVVRQGLSSPQIADSSFGFNMNLYHALKATLPLQDGPLMFELFRGIARALDVADRAVPECCQRKGVCAFSVVRRQLGMDDEHPEVTGNTGAGRGGNQSY
jgi:hypothetical protein